MIITFKFVSDKVTSSNIDSVMERENAASCEKNVHEIQHSSAKIETRPQVKCGM